MPKAQDLSSKQRRRRRLFTLLAVLSFWYVVICWILAKNYLSPTRNISEKPTNLTEVEVPLPDGKQDPSWATAKLAAGKPSKVVFIFAHGYGGNRHSWLELMPLLEAKGIDSVAPSMPGQDASPEPQVGFGFKEADTMVAVANWVRSKSPGVKIIYAGASMGGAAAWLASEKDPTAVGVISDGAYARFDETMYHWFERKAFGASYFLRPVIWMASAMSGLNPGDVNPMNSAAKWKGKPALVIQAGEDHLILRSHADRLVAASGAELWVVPDAEHVECFSVAKKEYVDRLAKFADRL